MKNFRKSKRVILPVSIVLIILFSLIYIFYNPFTKLFPVSAPSIESETYHESDTPLQTEKMAYNPYTYITDYIPAPIAAIEAQDIRINFQQLSEIQDDTDKLPDDIYAEYSMNNSLGIKDFIPEFNSAGEVSFSRISDNDFDNYQAFTDYLGDNTADFLQALSNMSEHRFSSINCVTFQKNSDIELGLISFPLFSNVEVNVLISKDFSKIAAIQKNSTYQVLNKVMESENVSTMKGVDLATAYHYQQRVFQENEESTTEEQYIYYTYFNKNNLEYLLQFKSNYTVLEGQKEYMVVGDLQTQEVCKNTLINLLDLLIGTQPN
ncbi:MAG: hypothetical protein QM644_12330 [Mobilitalea sp.]